MSQSDAVSLQVWKENIMNKKQWFPKIYVWELEKNGNPSIFNKASLFLNWKKNFIWTNFGLQYCLVLAIHQLQSAIGTYMSPPSWTSLPLPIPSHPSWLSQSPSLSSLSHIANHQITHGNIYVLCYSLLLSHCLPLANRCISTILLDSVCMH